MNGAWSSNSDGNIIISMHVNFLLDDREATISLGSIL